MDRKTRKQITVRLLEEVKRNKWNENSDKLIGETCAFCRNAISKYKNKYEDFDIKESNYCSMCLCPRNLCAKRGKKGLISKMTKKYIINTFVLDMCKEDFESFVKKIDIEINKRKENE